MVAYMISRYPTINVNQRPIEELTTIDDLNDFPLNFVTISSHQKKRQTVSKQSSQKSFIIH